MHSKQTALSRQTLCPQSGRQTKIHCGRQLPVLEFSRYVWYPERAQLVLNKLTYSGREIRALVGGTTLVSTLLKLAAGILRPRRPRLQLAPTVPGYIPGKTLSCFYLPECKGGATQWQQSGQPILTRTFRTFWKLRDFCRTTYQKLMSSSVRFVWRTAANPSPRKSAVYKSATAHS